MKMMIAAAVLSLAMCVTAMPRSRDSSNPSQFAVGALPGVNFPVPKSWAGNIPIGGSYGNDSLFFWLWAAETDQANNNLIIWLNGGPGSSSMDGLFKENGPILFPNNVTTPQPNKYSWTKLANVLYVDQPVGTGFSVGGDTPAVNNAGDTTAFVLWLTNFFNLFPAYKSKKIHILSESYGGIYAPYIADAIRQQKSTLGFQLTSIGFGDGTFGNPAALTDVVAVAYIQQHQNDFSMKLPADILNALATADQKCGFPDILAKLTYPPKGKISIPGNPGQMNYRRDTSSADFNLTTCDFNGGTTTAAQVTAIVNGLGPDAAQDCALFGPCDTFDAAAYWIADSGNQAGCWNQYNIDYPCDETVDSTAGFVAYLNQPEVQSAIHAPQIQFHLSNYAVQFLLGSEHVVPPAYSIIPNLLAAGTKVHIWSGQKDYFLNHIGTELAIQNMTWNGAQGLQNPPNKKFYDCQNNLAGTYGAERGLSYHLFKDAGHQTPMDDPSAVFAFVENTVVGSSGSNRH